VFHIKLPTNELRAFSFNDTPICIVIGTNDSSTGKTFSLFHELGHVVRRQSGLCNPFKEGVSSQTIEGWCNMFAGELLMPIELMELEGSTLRQLNGTDERTQSQIARIAKKFKVSRYALLTRALVLDWIKQRQYDLLVETMGLSIPGKDFGRAHPDAVSAKRCLSKCGVRLVSLVLYGMQKGIINIGSASDYLGTKPENLSNLRRLVGSL
jgi:Zn-dependent peptidase ImmA (M78 family)